MSHLLLSSIFDLLHSCLFILLLSFFFLIIQRPQKSTLFPTRRSSDLKQIIREMYSNGKGAEEIREKTRIKIGYVRSEEHTSELQSRFDIVCRLLLEKKN